MDTKIIKLYKRLWISHSVQKPFIVLYYSEHKSRAYSLEPEPVQKVCESNNR